MSTGTIQIRCGNCGHKADAWAFCETPVSGELPVGTFQCPACHVAFRMCQGPPKIYESGFVVPGDVTIVEVDSVL